MHQKNQVLKRTLKKVIFFVKIFIFQEEIIEKLFSSKSYTLEFSIQIEHDQRIQNGNQVHCFVVKNIKNTCIIISSMSG